MASTNTPLLKQPLITPKAVTASRVLTGTDSGTSWTNTNATGSITFTLPKAASGLTTVVSGLQFTFLISAAQPIVITPKTGDTIRGLAVSASYTLTGVGDCVQLTCIAPGFWDVICNTFPYGILTGPGGSTLSAPVTITAKSGNISLTVNGASGQPALVVNGNERLSGGIQITGYDTSGFTGQGIEVGLASSIGYVQAYDRSAVGWLSLVLDGNDISLYVGGSTATSLVLSTNATFLTMSNSSAGYSSAYGGVAGFRINNASGTMQSSLDFGKASVLTSRLRSDYAGNMTYVTTSAGVHQFFYGGDSGTGTLVAQINSNGLTQGVAAYLIQNLVTWTNHAAAAAGTLGNAPVAGNPTKWIAINDNGTTRYIPAW